MDRPPQPLFLGGQLWIDFVNTRPVLAAGEVDLLPNPQALMAWLRAAELLEPSVERPQRKALGGLFAKALRLRDGLRELAARVPAGKGVPAAAVDLINEILGARPGTLQLARVRGGFALRAHSEQTSTLQLLEPIVASAAAFLCSGDRALLRRCEGCVLHFYDSTRNHRRRFCSPALCGNRLKVAAFRQRRKAAGR